MLLERRLVICEVDISTIPHSTGFSSTQKIFLWCEGNKTKEFLEKPTAKLLYITKEGRWGGREGERKERVEGREGRDGWMTDGIEDSRFHINTT